MSVQPLLNYINKFVNLTEKEQHFISSKVVFRKYQKGQYILQQGDVCKYQCYIVSGCTKIFYADDNGQEHVIMFSIEDWWSSDVGSFINQTPANYNIRCIEDTEMIQITFNVKEELLREVPKLERFFRLIIEKGFVASEKRIIRNFSLSAKDRYLIFKESYPKIEQRIPQYMLASYLGITKEFLSKIKNKLVLEN